MVVERSGADPLGVSPGRTDRGITLLRDFDGGRPRSRRLPERDDLTAAFTTAGFATAALRPVPQVTASSLREAAASCVARRKRRSGSRCPSAGAPANPVPRRQPRTAARIASTWPTGQRHRLGRLLAHPSDVADGILLQRVVSDAETECETQHGARLLAHAVALVTASFLMNWSTLLTVISGSTPDGHRGLAGQGSVHAPYQLLAGETQGRRRCA